MTSRCMVLREISDSDGTRLLTASLNAEGDLVIEGRDHGPGVERIFGVSEYEWAWTIPAAAIGHLLQALQATGKDVLAAIGDRFSGETAGGLGVFLESNQVPTQRWSRLGD